MNASEINAIANVVSMNSSMTASFDSRKELAETFCKENPNYIVVFASRGTLESRVGAMSYSNEGAWSYSEALCVKDGAAMQNCIQYLFTQLGYAGREVKYDDHVVIVPVVDDMF